MLVPGGFLALEVGTAGYHMYHTCWVSASTACWVASVTEGQNHLMQPLVAWQCAELSQEAELADREVHWALRTAGWLGVV
jgi:hypothetical protein